MKLNILAWGKAGQGPEAELTARYLKRIQWPVSLTELSPTQDATPPPSGSRTVLLDERGKSLSSDKFAEILGRWRDEGVRETRFLIGPADGHTEAARNEADLLIAFGAATWPHLLVRAMLAEQLYRALSILSGHPYHRKN